MYYPNNNFYNPYLQNQQQIYQPQYLNNQVQQQPQYSNIQMTASNLNGKVINKVEDIIANDVPMDGSNAFFPLSDNSKIIVKKWNSNGTINTIEYSPIATNNVDNTNNPEQNLIDLKPITERLDGIEEMLNKLTKKTTSKKEVIENE